MAFAYKTSLYKKLEDTLAPPYRHSRPPERACVGLAKLKTAQKNR